MYSIVNTDSVLEKIGLSNELVESIVEKSIVNGVPYIEVCRECCSEYYVCILTKVLPVDIEEYRVETAGIIVVVNKNKQVDKNIEELLSKSSTIKYISGKVSFYIPLEYTIYIYSKLCREHGEAKYEVRTVEEEEVLIYLGEENDSS